MSKEEINDLWRYFRLITYRDEGDILLEEYDELNQIIKRNKVAAYLEELRYQSIIGKISEEDYNCILTSYFEMLNNSKVLKYVKKQ